MNKLKEFNYKYIYSSNILRASNEYFDIVITTIYRTLKESYDFQNTFKNLTKLKRFYPILINGFIDWFNNFSKDGNRKNLKNKILFDITKPEDFFLSIITYISGMTDKFAIDTYNEIIGF